MDQLASTVPNNDASSLINAGTIGGSQPGADTQTRLMAVIAVARHHGLDLHLEDFRPALNETTPSPASLAAWARDQGLSAKAERVRWKQLFRLQGNERPASPVVLLLKDGGAGLLVGSDASRNVIWIRDPAASSSDPAIPVDELRLSQAWNGEVLLIRRLRGESEGEQRFSLGWLMGLVAKEKRSLRDISVGSITLSALTIIPPLLVMTVVDRVVTHHSLSTLVLLSTILLITTMYETLLGYARRELVQVVSTRVDARLHLHVFNRLLGLPLDYFEKNPAGQINYRLMQVWKIREFLTGKLMGTFLDMFTLVFLVPLLFWMESTLAWIVLVCAVIIALVIMAFLPALRKVIGKLTIAESEKASTMVETVHGIRTVKSLALEPQRRSEWDERTAKAGKLKLQAGRLANWPQTIINPIESFIQRGVIMIGAYIAMQDTTGIAVGGLVAFMMLGSRVTQPLVGLARLVEDFEDVRASIGQVAAVLNNPNETAAMQGRPAPEVQGRRDVRGPDLHLSRLETAGARQGWLRYSGRHHAGRRRAQRIGQEHDHPSAARHQPRVQRLPQDRRRRVARDQPHAPAPELRCRAAGQLPVPRHGTGQHHRGTPWLDAGGRDQGVAASRRGGVH